MRIVVAVKHVPDVQSTRRLGADGRLVRGDGDGSLNELDENAVEAAVRLAATTSAEVVAVTVGPAQAVDAVRRALQMGADRAVHVCDDRLAGLDAAGTAAVLAAVVTAQQPVDVVLAGMSSTDGMTGVVPTMLAAALGVPALPLASEITLVDGRVVVRRELDRTIERVAAPVPVVVSVTDAANEPSFPGFRAIMAARRKPVQTLGLDELRPHLAALGLDAQSLAPRTRVLSAAPRPPRAEQVLDTDDGQAAARLAAWLVDRHLA